MCLSKVTQFQILSLELYEKIINEDVDVDGFEKIENEVEDDSYDDKGDDKGGDDGGGC